MTKCKKHSAVLPGLKGNTINNANYVWIKEYLKVH